MCGCGYPMHHKGASDGNTWRDVVRNVNICKKLLYTCRSNPTEEVNTTKTQQNFKNLQKSRKLVQLWRYFTKAVFTCAEYYIYTSLRIRMTSVSLRSEYWEVFYKTAVN